MAGLFPASLPRSQPHNLLWVPRSDGDRSTSGDPRSQRGREGERERERYVDDPLPCRLRSGPISAVQLGSSSTRLWMAWMGYRPAGSAFQALSERCLITASTPSSPSCMQLSLVARWALIRDTLSWGCCWAWQFYCSTFSITGRHTSAESFTSRCEPNYLHGLHCV